MRSMARPRRCAGIVIALVALALGGVAPAARATPGVLVVGDSLEELTSPYLGRFLPGV